MKYSSRFSLFAPVTLFLVFLAVVGVHWWLVADAFSAWLAKANGREIAPGVTLRFASRQMSGFPFSLDTVFRDVSFEIATPQGPIVWHTQNFAMHSLTYGRDQTIFEAAGKQELDWTKADGSKHALPFAVGSLHASSISGKDGLTRFDLDLVGFGSRDFTAQRLQFHIKRDKADTLDVAVMADLPLPINYPKAPTGHRELLGSITDAHMLDDVRTGLERWYAGLEDWRKAGGELIVRNYSNQFCGLDLSGRGEFHLDDRHRIAGAMPLRLNGHSATQIVPDTAEQSRNNPSDGGVETIVVTSIPLEFSSWGPLY